MVVVVEVLLLLMALWIRAGDIVGAGVLILCIQEWIPRHNVVIEAGRPVFVGCK